MIKGRFQVGIEMDNGDGTSTWCPTFGSDSYESALEEALAGKESVLYDSRADIFLSILIAHV